MLFCTRLGNKIYLGQLYVVCEVPESALRQAFSCFGWQIDHGPVTLVKSFKSLV